MEITVRIPTAIESATEEERSAGQSSEPKPLHVHPDDNDRPIPVRNKWMRLSRTALLLSMLVSLLQSIPMNSIRAEYLNAFRHHVALSYLLKLLLPSVCTLLLACFAFVFRIPFSFCGCCDRWEWSSAAIADAASGSDEKKPWRVLHYGLFVLMLVDIVAAFLALLLGA